MTFDEASQSFDPITQILNISVNVSWDKPPNTNGNLQYYSITVFRVVGANVERSLNVSSSEFMVVLSFLSLSPFTQYETTVTAVTGGGSSVANITRQSPEAGGCGHISKYMFTALGYTNLAQWYIMTALSLATQGHH